MASQSTRSYLPVAVAIVVAGALISASLFLAISETAATSTYVTTSTSTTVTTSTSVITDASASGSTVQSENYTSGQLGQWNGTASYPFAALNPSCVTYENYAYCVGGGNNKTYSNETYYSLLSSNGTGPWIRTTDYPVGIEDESCVVTNGYMYCIGGYIGSVTEDVYYATLSPSGIGQWIQTASYPHPFENSCVATSGYIYCAGAKYVNGTGFTLVGEAYFTAVSADGSLKNWTETTGPPTATAGCTMDGGYIYCFGGGSCSPPGDCLSPSYFAPLSSNGIGDWANTTELPTSGYAIYAAAESHIFYFSTPVYSAPSSPAGIGQWNTTTNYPESGPSACFSNANYIYCIGGGNLTAITNHVYYAEVGVQNPNALHLQNPPPFQNAEYLIPSWDAGGGCSVTYNGKTEGGICWGFDIDQAVVFQCLSAAATTAGCTTTVVSPGYPQYNYDLTIWYPKVNSSLPDTNCQLVQNFGSSSPTSAWCITVGPNSFIVSIPAPPLVLLTGSRLSA